MADRSMKIEILTDTSKATKGLKDVEGAAKSFHGVLTNEVSKSVPAVGGLLGKLDLGAGDLSASLGKALPYAAASGAAAIGAFAVKSIAAFQEQSQEVLHFKQVSGLAAEEASKFIAVADDYGISAEDMSTAIGKLNKTAGATPAALQKVGVEIATNAKGNYDAQATFLNVVDAYNATNDASAKAAIGAAAFGKGWQGVVKILDAGSGQIRSDFAKVADFQLFNDKDLKKSEEWRLALDDLSDTFKGFQRQVGEALVPALKWGLEKIKEFTGGVKEATQSVGGFTVGLGALGALALSHPFVAAGVGLVALGQYLADATKNNARLKEEFVGTTQKIHDQALAAQNAADEQANNASKYVLQEAAKVAADKYALAERSRIDAQYASNDGYRKSLDATREALDKATLATDNLRAAQRSLFNDQLGLQGAIYSSLDAIDAYRAKVADTTTTTREQEQANINVQQSFDAVAQKAIDTAAQQAVLHGAVLTANGALDAQLSALREVAKELGPEDGKVRAELDLYMLKLFQIPGTITTNVDLTGLDWLIGRGREGNSSIGGQVSSTPNASTGGAIVSNIKAFESSNGTAWRSGPQ